MTLQQLSSVREIVQQGFCASKAAGTLGMTQPGLSGQILALARELGVDIFMRRGNRLVELSQAGAFIHELAGPMLLQAEGIRRVGREARNQTHGNLTVATTHTQARYALPNVVQAFVRRFPEIGRASC